MRARLPITQTSVDKNNPTFHLGGVSITLGGFLDATAITRSANLTSEGNRRAYNSIPFNNSHQCPCRRIPAVVTVYTSLSFLAQGNVSDHVKVAGYVESDFARRRGDRQFEPDQQLHAAPAPSLHDHRRHRGRSAHPGRSGLFDGDRQHYRDHAAQGVVATCHRRQLHARLHLHPAGAGADRQGFCQQVSGLVSRSKIPQEIYSFQTASGSALPNGSDASPTPIRAAAS